MSKVPHKHADMIKAWADGANIQGRSEYFKDWRDVDAPEWYKDCEYRIKPEPKPDIIMYGQENNPLTHARSSESVMPCVLTYIQTRFDQVKYTFDGETGKLKNVEIIK